MRWLKRLGAIAALIVLMVLGIDLYRGGPIFGCAQSPSKAFFEEIAQSATTKEYIAKQAAERYGRHGMSGLRPDDIVIRDMNYLEDWEVLSFTVGVVGRSSGLFHGTVSACRNVELR